MVATRIRGVMFGAVSVLAAVMITGAAVASDIGQIKVAKGTVLIERGNERLIAGVGEQVRRSDVIRTGVNGSVGITFIDNSMLSAGPDSVIVLEQYSFNTTTHEGRFETSVRNGTLSVISGKIAKQSPEAMTVRTPAAILGVRGTEFLVQVGAGR
jgi:hypothetical protein